MVDVGGVVLAEDFGYQLSPKPAVVMTPEVQEKVDEALEDAAKAAAGVESEAAGWVAFGVFMACGILAWYQREPLIFIAGIVAAFVIMGVGNSTSVKARRKAMADARPRLPRKGCGR